MGVLQVTGKAKGLSLVKPCQGWLQGVLLGEGDKTRLFLGEA